MRFGDSRVQALAGVLCVTPCVVTGINRSLRALMTGLLGVPYGITQASYDLARLRRNGLITDQRLATPDSPPQHETRLNCRTPSDKGWLESRPAQRGEGVDQVGVDDDVDQFTLRGWPC